MKYKPPVITELGQEFDDKKIIKIALRKRFDPQDTELGADASVHGYGVWVTNAHAAVNVAAAVNAVVYANAVTATMAAAAVAFVLLAGAFWFPSKFKRPQIAA
jgi:hypothetical protein